MYKEIQRNTRTKQVEEDGCFQSEWKGSCWCCFFSVWIEGFVENIEQDYVTVTPATDFEFTTRTNRTNRVEILEEYYENSTKVDQVEPTTEIVEMKEIVVLSANVSAANDNFNGTNITVVEEIDTVVQSVNNETFTEQVPFVLLHKEIIMETTTEVLPNPENSTASFVSELVETISSTKADVNSTTSVMIATTEEKEVSIESTTTVHIGNDSIAVTTESESMTTTMEVTVESTTMESTTSTSAVPVDCPVLKDCPFDSCAFARKLDNRGCPTCNCLQSSNGNITCPSLPCPGCPYGHYTDTNGVCSFASLSFKGIRFCDVFSVQLVNVKIVLIHH